MKLIGCDCGVCPDHLRSTICGTLIKCGCSGSAIRNLIDAGYFTAPASAGHHLAVTGGLALHSYTVARRLCELSKVIGCDWLRPDGPIVVGLLHDLVKIECYRRTEHGWQFVGSKGSDHGYRSMQIAENLGFELRSDESLAIVTHMGGYGTTWERELYNRSVGRGGYYRQVLATHMADMIACHVDERGADIYARR